MRQRTTTYGEVPAERIAAAAVTDGVCASVRAGLPILTALARLSAPVNQPQSCEQGWLRTCGVTQDPS
jgi:hypothetical protein